MGEVGKAWGLQKVWTRQQRLSADHCCGGERGQGLCGVDLPQWGFRVGDSWSVWKGVCGGQWGS